MSIKQMQTPKQQKRSQWRHDAVQIWRHDLWLVKNVLDIVFWQTTWLVCMFARALQRRKSQSVPSAARLRRSRLTTRPWEVQPVPKRHGRGEVSWDQERVWRSPLEVWRWSGSCRCKKQARKVNMEQQPQIFFKIMMMMFQMKMFHTEQWPQDCVRKQKRLKRSE